MKIKKLLTLLGVILLGKSVSAQYYSTNCYSVSTYTVGSVPYDIAVADFNSDSNKDFAVCNYGSNNFELRLGFGNGSFASSNTYTLPAGFNPLKVTTGDYNNDSKTDIVVLGATNGLGIVFLNNGSGGMVATNTVYTIGSDPYSVSTADFNNDGKKDFMVVRNSSNIGLYLGTGTGSFATNSFSVSGIVGPRGLCTGDFNNDGNMDFSVCNSLNTYIVLGNGTGTFSYSAAQGITTSSPLVALESGDYNADGYLDILSGDYGSNGFIFYGNGLGGFLNQYPKLTYMESANYGLTNADFDGDGKLDFACVGLNGNTIGWRINSGNGNGFSGNSIYLGNNTGPRSMKSADFNNDGTPDLVTANTGTNYVTVFLLNTVKVNPSFATRICAGSSATMAITTPGTYSWSTGANNTPSIVVTPSVTTYYTFTGSIANSCTFTVYREIEVIGSPTITASGGTICSGQTFTLSPVGANSYSYPGGSPVVSPSVTTSYSIVGNSGYGCNLTNTTVASVTVLPTPTITVASGTICTGQSFFLNPSGAALYINSGGSMTVSPVSFTTYTVTGTNTANCVSAPVVASVAVSASTPATVSVNSGSICSGNTFFINPSGAVTYSIQGGSAAVSPGSTQNYSVIGYNSAGCVSTNTATSTVSVFLTPTLSVSSGSICNGTIFNINPTGASSFTIQGGSSIVSPGSSQSYTVVGSSTAGCISGIATSSVTVNPTPTVSVNGGTICSGSNFIIVPTGANTYSIQGGTATVSPGTSTSYTVRGISAAGCISANTATCDLLVNVTPTVTVNSGTICTGQVFTLNPTGANTYTYSGGTNTVSPVATSFYSVSGSSTAGCVSSVAISNVTVNPVPNLTVNSGSICTGEVFTLTPTGAYTYTFSSGSSTVSPAVNSSYSVTGTSSAGCVATNTAVAAVTVNARPNIGIGNFTICAGNTVTFIPTGASTYTYSNGSSTVIPAVSQSYSISGTNSLGCVSASPAISSVSVNPVPSISVNSGSICSGFVFTINPVGALTYTLSSISNTVAPLTNTFYTVSGTSSAGCVSTIQAISQITVNPVPSISVNSGTVCLGNTFSIIPSGAFTYTYSGGSNTVSPATTTSYSVTGTSSAGCVANNTAVSAVTVNPLPTINIGNFTICAGTTVTFLPTGALTYSFSSGSNTVAPTASQNYSITGTNSLGCVSATPAISSVSVNPVPVVSVNSGSICSGSVFTIMPTGALTYVFSGGSNTVAPLVNANYSVIGTSSAGCVSTIPAVSQVTVNAIPVISVNNGTICSGKTFTMIPSGAFTYTYSSGTNTVSPMTTGSYSVTGASSAGCVAANTAISTVTVFTTPTISVNSGSICSGASFAIVPSGAVVYSVNGGNFTVSPVALSSYSVTGTSSAGCVSQNTAISTVTVFSSPTIAVNNGSVCYGNSFVILPSGAATYTVGGGSFTVSPTTTTSYTVTGTSSAGCISSNSIVSNVIVKPLPTITVTGSTLICVGETASINASGADAYSWSDGSTAPSIIVSPSLSTNYTVTGTDINNCSKSYVVSLLVAPCLGFEGLLPKKENYTVKIYPNPTEGVLYIDTKHDEKPFEVRIFDIAGKMVYSKTISQGNNALDISGLAPAVYIVEVETDEHVVFHSKIAKN